MLLERTAVFNRDLAQDDCLTAPDVINRIRASQATQKGVSRTSQIQSAARCEHWHRTTEDRTRFRITRRQRATPSAERTSSTSGQERQSAFGRLEIVAESDVPTTCSDVELNRPECSRATTSAEALELTYSLYPIRAIKQSGRARSIELGEVMLFVI